jgi:flagellar motility protein MotE (MotC chaperone)
MVCDAPAPAVEAASEPSADNDGETASDDKEEPIGHIASKLRARRLELERREAELARKEEEWHAREAKAAAPALKAAAAKPSAKQAAAARRDANMQRLVELVAEMKAKPAVNFLNALSDAETAQILLRLDKTQAVAILAALPAPRAAHVSRELAQGGTDATH